MCPLASPRRTKGADCVDGEVCPVDTDSSGKAGLYCSEEFVANLPDAPVPLEDGYSRSSAGACIVAERLAHLSTESFDSDEPRSVPCNATRTCATRACRCHPWAAIEDAYVL